MDGNILSLLLMFVNTSKVAGWTRAGVGALFAIALAKWSWLGQYVDPSTQNYIALAASGIAVGIWSHLAKWLSAQAAAQSPAIAGYGADGQVRKLPLAILAIGVSAALLALLAAPAFAADVLPTKAPPAAPSCTLQQCSGFYAGINIGESGSNFSGGTSANQFALGGNAGYQFWNGQWFIAAEFDALYGLTQNGTVPGGGNSALWGIGGLAKIGYSLSSVFGAAANASAQPVLPSSLQNALIAPYAILGIWDRPWGAGFVSGAGVEALLANNWTFHVDYLHVNYNNAAVNVNVNQQTEDLILAGIDYHFK